MTSFNLYDFFKGPISHTVTFLGMGGGGMGEVGLQHMNLGGDIVQAVTHSI